MNQSELELKALKTNVELLSLRGLEINKENLIALANERSLNPQKPFMSLTQQHERMMQNSGHLTPLELLDRRERNRRESHSSIETSKEATELNHAFENTVRTAAYNIEHPFNTEASVEQAALEEIRMKARLKGK